MKCGLEAVLQIHVKYKVTFKNCLNLNLKDIRLQPKGKNMKLPSGVLQCGFFAFLFKFNFFTLTFILLLIFIPYQNHYNHLIK